MINDDILIKFSRQRGHKEDWPQHVRFMRNRLYEGIGIGLDLDDPDRRMYRYKDIIPVLPFNDINGNSLCIRINVRPDLTGGPGYYYFYKSYRDFRM